MISDNYILVGTGIKYITSEFGYATLFNLCFGFVFISYGSGYTLKYEQQNKYRYPVPDPGCFLILLNIKQFIFNFLRFIIFTVFLKNFETDPCFESV